MSLITKTKSTVVEVQQVLCADTIEGNTITVTDAFVDNAEVSGLFTATDVTVTDQTILNTVAATTVNASTNLFLNNVPTNTLYVTSNETTVRPVIKCLSYKIYYIYIL